MKHLLTKISLFLLVFVSLSCEEDVFECEKNSIVDRNGQQCANAIIDKVTGEPDIDGFVMRLSWNTASLSISIKSDTPLEEKTYAIADGASFHFNELNRTDEVSITLSKVDTENRTISGFFNVAAEGNINSQAFDYTANGNFTEVQY